MVLKLKDEDKIFINLWKTPTHNKKNKPLL
jgi:hypothetical protein